MASKLNSVLSVMATIDPAVFILHCNITDLDGNTYDTDYCSHPDDTYGLNPTIRQWLADNPDFPVQPHTPPTVEGIRMSMPSLTARQFRLGLLDVGISPSQVTSSIDDMPTGPDKDRAEIEWEYAATFNRSDHLINMIKSGLGLADERIDAMWLAAVSF